MPKKKISALVKSYADAAQSESTRINYRRDMNHYAAWGGKVPATAEMIAEYVAAYASSLKIATLAHRLAAIRQAHQDRGFSNPVSAPLVKQTMEGIRRSFGIAPRRVRALVKDDLVEVLVTVAQQKPLRAARDKAMLLIGWAAALRRSELVALTRDDVTDHELGISLMIRKSKTDQRGVGDTVFVPRAKSKDRCPVLALHAWLELAEISTGALFRQVSRHDCLVGERGLTPQAVAQVVKRAVCSAYGHEASLNFAAHSLRAGYATSGVEAGLPVTDIMRVTRHKSAAILLNVYVRPNEKRQTRSLL